MNRRRTTLGGWRRIGRTIRSRRRVRSRRCWRRMATSFRTCALRPHLDLGAAGYASHSAAFGPGSVWAAAAGGRRHEPCGHYVCRECCGGTFAGGGCTAGAHAAGSADVAHNGSGARVQRHRPGGKAYFISQGEPVNCWQWIDEILALVDLPPVRKIDVVCERRGELARRAKTCIGLLGSIKASRR